MDSDEQAQRTQYWAELPACSNEMFADLDEWIARAVLSQARDTLHDLDEEMAQVKKAGKPLGALIERHSLASERVDKLAVGVAPHKRLPPEVLSQIFIRAMEGKELTVPSFTRQVPGILGQVCSQWRAVAHAEPRLWNRIRICSKFSSGALETIRTVILRSGCLPMSIVVVESNRTSVCKALETLGSQSDRIGALEITLDLEASKALAAGTYSFANLQTLDLVIHRTIFQLAAVPVTVTAFSSSAKLRCLKIGGLVYGFFGARIPIDYTGFNATSLPWHQLSDLRVELALPLSNLSMVLQWCKALVNCVVSTPTQDTSPMPHSECTLKLLRHLTIHIHCSSVGLDMFLAHLICPALEVLKVHSDDHPSFLTTWTVQNRTDFVLRSPKVRFM